MFLDPFDHQLVAWGWPWHGLGRTTTSSYEATITTASDQEINVPLLNNNRRWTYLFDAGLPDISDPAVEAEGGEWWGRAILRAVDGLAVNFCWGAGMYSDFNGINTSDNFYPPLWWRPDPEDPDPIFEPVQMVFSYSGSASSYTLRLSRLGRFINGGDGSDEASIVVSVSDMQQASGPTFAAKDLNQSPLWWQVTPGQYTGMALEFHKLGIWENRILLGLVWRVSESSGRPLLPHPPATTPGDSGSSPSGAPVAYSGLIELVAGPVMLDPDGDYSAALSINVVESLTTASGDAQHTYTDTTDPVSGARNVFDERVESGGLLTAWYDGEGVIRTARYNRTQTATYEQTDLLPELPDKYNTIRTRRTELDLLFGATMVDSRFLEEKLEIFNESPTRWGGRSTIKETGQTDDVSDFTDGGYDEPEVNPTFMVGSHLAMGSLAQIVGDGFGNNLLDYQDIRLVWIAPSSNNVCSLSRSREPYDYADGQESMTVNVSSGPAVGPLGAVGGVVSHAITRPKTTPGNFWRGFFSNAGRKWVWATGNPVTGQVVRARDYYDEPDTFFDWV